MADHNEVDDDQIISDDEDNWDWQAGENDDFLDEIGEDFREDDDQSCKCLFMSVVQPSPQDALEYEKDKLGFDFHKTRSELSLY